MIYFQIKELNLDNCRATLIEGLTTEFKNLESLSLINVGLTTLKGLPSLPSLKKVIVINYQLANMPLKMSLNALNFRVNFCLAFSRVLKM